MGPVVLVDDIERKTLAPGDLRGQQHVLFAFAAINVDAGLKPVPAQKG